MTQEEKKRLLEYLKLIAETYRNMSSALSLIRTSEKAYQHLSNYHCHCGIETTIAAMKTKYNHKDRFTQAYIDVLTDAVDLMYKYTGKAPIFDVPAEYHNLQHYRTSIRFYKKFIYNSILDLNSQLQ